MEETPRQFDTLGAALRRIRASRDLLQQDVAERAEITRSMLSGYEHGHKYPQIETLERLLDALGVTVGELAETMEEIRRARTLEDVESGESEVVVRAVLRALLDRKVISQADLVELARSAAETP